MQIIGGAQVALETGPQMLQCWDSIDMTLDWWCPVLCQHAFTQDICWPCFCAARVALETATHYCLVDIMSIVLELEFIQFWWENIISS